MPGGTLTGFQEGLVSWSPDPGQFSLGVWCWAEIGPLKLGVCPMRTEPPCRGPVTAGPPQQGHVKGVELSWAQTGAAAWAGWAGSAMAIRPQEPSCCSGETKLPSLGQWWALPWAPLCICDLGPLGLEDG